MRKLTKEEFVEKARSVHGDLYDYSKVEYAGGRTKVTIIDPEFGEFQQVPQSHLRGHGNPNRAVIIRSDKRRDCVQEFIEKARAVHGDLYDYSKVEYVNSTTKVIIIDPEFGEFEQLPSAHVSGRGNPDRGKIIRIKKQTRSTEKFIDKAREVHGDFYDYSKVEYVNSSTKVIIIDPKFGEFEQAPKNHLKGYGNQERGGTKKLTTKTFVEKAREVHGNLYDYSKVNYVDAYTKVIIIDPDFGEFSQAPYAHLSGKGNSTRGGSRQLTKEEFIEKARKKHGDLYDYSKVEYVNSTTKVIIIDPEFGEFEQTPNSHLHGYGNLERSGNSKITTEEFIEKARAVHGDLYDYSKVKYLNRVTKIEIVDPEHGTWKQSPANHLKGCGHPKRAFNPPGSLLYVIEVEQGLEHFAKVGITTVSVEKRFPKLSGAITTHYLHDFEDRVREVENAVLGHVKEMNGLQPAQCLEGNGSTECFKPALIPDVLKFLETNY